MYYSVYSLSITVQDVIVICEDACSVLVCIEPRWQEVFMVLMACWCLCWWECLAQLGTGTGGCCCLSAWGQRHGKKLYTELIALHCLPVCPFQCISWDLFLNYAAKQVIVRLMVQVWSTVVNSRVFHPSAVCYIWWHDSLLGLTCLFLCIWQNQRKQIYHWLIHM